MLNRRHFLKTASFATASLTLAASMSRVGNAAQENFTFSIGSLEEPGSLSALVQLPHHFPADVPQTLLFDSLTQFMPDGTVEPKLATAWEISEDELTYTFRLNPNARFHDGEPVTAEDVVFTIEASKDPASNSSDEGLENVASVTADDENTVTIVLSQVTPAFLAQGGARGIVPKHVLEGRDIATDEFNRNPIGNGPYRLVSYTPGEVIVFEAVEDHYRGAPEIERVEFRVVTDQNVLLTQLMNGELTYGLAAPRDISVLDNTDAVEMIEVQTPRFFDMIPNYERTYWQDRDVRAAILGAIDREGIVTSILMGHGSVVNSNVAPASWAHTTEGVTQHPYDPEASAAALDAAGWEIGEDDIREKDGVAFAFTVTLYSYDQTLQQAMLVAQQNLAGMGVEMQIEMVEPGVFNARRSSGEYDALARIWNPVYDPDQAILLSTGNWYGYSNPEVDALSNEALATADQATRLPVYEELQRVLSQELPRLWLYSENELHVLSTSVSGLDAHPVNVFWNLPTWSVN